MKSGRYQVYGSYKNAESKWLDIIPDSWSRSPIKHIVLIRITDGPHETPEFLDDGVPFLSAEAVKNNALDFSKKRGYIRRFLHELYSRKCLPKRDDIFMVKSGNTTGALAIVETDEEFNIWSPLALIRANRKIAFPRFVFFSMQADFFKTSVELSWSQGTQPNIGMGVIENLHVALPSLPEQTQISAFLDHETAKIERLIEKQQALISLFKEKRQAVISHAVTKGLNPRAPLKDSGIEWLGQVPAHWDAGKTKYFAQLKTGHTPSRSKPEYWENCHIPWISLADVWQIRDLRNFYIEETNEKISERGLANSAAELLPKGTVIVSRTASVGFSGIMARSMATTQDFVNWIPGPALSSEYLLFVFRAMAHVFDMLKVGSTHKTIYMPDVLGFTTPVPPLSEQKQIVEAIRERLASFDKATTAAEDAITLLQERRTALISAAVTGKIDVRHWQPSEN